MKKLNWLFLLVFLALGCQDDHLVNEPGVVSNLRTSASSVTINCNENNSLSVAVNNVVTGSLDVAVGANSVEFYYNLTGSEYFLMSDMVFAGDCQATPAPGDYQHSDQFTTDEEVRSHDFSIDLANLPECGCITVTADVARYNSRTSAIESFPWTETINYCKCEDEEEPDDENLRTQTQGGWGAEPNGNNPGAYLHENFTAAFPGGLQVGCTYTITLTSAQAVTDFLPQGGTASQLLKNWVNPDNAPKSANNPKNVLAGQVVALKLSIGFDEWDEDFGVSNTDLADATIASGTFAGWTVADVLAAAEELLGGCESDYTAAQLNEVVTAINESFVDGTTDSGFLNNEN